MMHGASVQHGSEATLGYDGSDLDQRSEGAGAPLIFGIVIACTVLQLFAVPGTGVVGLGLPVSLALIGWGYLAGLLTIDPFRLVPLMMMLSALGLTLAMQSQPFSPTALMLLMVVYLPFVLMAVTTGLGHIEILGAFRRVMIFCAWCGLGQFAIQFVAGPEWMFPFHKVLPESMFVQGFNLQIPLSSGLPYLKSTGLWFLEPSHFSQALALAVIIEITYFRRLLVLGLFGVAYLTSVSGTGFVLLAATMLPIIVYSRQIWLLGLILAGIVTVVLFQDIPPFSLFIERLGDFSNPLSSGSMRFVGPYWFVADVVAATPSSLWFGLGPGSIASAVGQTDYAVQDSVWLKMLTEYGVIGLASFLTFYLWVTFRHSPNRILSFAFLVQAMLLGGYLSAYYVQYLMLVLVGWPRLEPSSSESAA